MSLAELYDRAFFRAYGAANPIYAESCRLIAAEIYQRFRPQSVVDWGCGAGLHAAAISRLGAVAVGVDGVAVDDDLRAPGLAVVIADLTSPIEPPLVPDRYDLSLCLDVLEHIPAEHADRVLDNVCRDASLVILSCAPPHQGGHHHVNEQPRRYWVARMARRGWYYDRKETGAMEQTFLAMRDRLPWTWMFHNLCVYRRAPASGDRSKT
jgi:SAM-dependent methyltransferase